MARRAGTTAAACALACAFAVLLAGCSAGGRDDIGQLTAPMPAPAPAPRIARNPDNAAVTLTIGSKNFTEQKILGEIYAQAFAAAGYTVHKRLDLGDENAAMAALRDGTISGYPEYTGTVLLSFLHVVPARVPSDKGEAYERARTGMALRGITAFPPTPFTSSNEVGLLRGRAEELGVTKISDLADHDRDLVLYGSPECRTRRDCLAGLEQIYGLHFRRFVAVDVNLRHQVLLDGDADASIVFTTDPQIKRNNEVLLEDDKGMFPPNNSTFLMKATTARRAGPDLAAAIEAVGRNLTNEVMQELNARVDLDRDTPRQAAQAYLKQFNLIPS